MNSPPGSAHGVPCVNVGFELRQNEGGLSTNATQKDVNNAISQLNQAYMPFHVGLLNKEAIEQPGMMRQYASHHGKDHVFLLLLTNAKIVVFEPPEKFSGIGEVGDKDGELFKEYPWILFQPENSLSLQSHQKHVAAKFSAPSGKIKEERDADILKWMIPHAHEVHIVNFDHVDKFFEMAKNPPRIEGININIKVNDTDSGLSIAIPS